MKTAAAYIRVSTDDQLEYSPDSQLEAIKNFAKRNDYYLPKEFIFVDEGISGRKASIRPAFMQMISIAKTKPAPFDAIIVWKFSRFARSREDSIVYKSMLKKQCKIDVISVSEQLSEDKTSILIEALLEAMDEYYSINLAEEVKRGMTEKAKRGEPQTVPPFGYGIKDKQFIINENEAKYVKTIFNDYVSGTGFTAIAKKLNSLGLKTHRGNQFEARTVEYILRNPVYIGKLRWNPAGKTRRNYDDENILVVNASHQPIIDEKTFEQAQLLISKQKTAFKYMKPVNRNDNITTWLRGIIRCNECGGAMVKNVPGSLQCNNYVHGRNCFSHSVSVSKLENSVLNYLKETAISGNIDDYITVSKSKNVSGTNYDALLKKAEQKLNRIKEAYQAGIDTIDEYRENKHKIDNEIKELKREATASLKKTPDFAAFKKALIKTCKVLESNAPIAEKNRVLKTIVNCIYFSRPSNEIRVNFIIEM